MYTLKIVERLNPEQDLDLRNDYAINAIGAVNLRESYHELSCDAEVVFFEDNPKGAVAYVADNEQKYFIYDDVDAYLMNENAVTVRIIHRVPR
ncbi:hypothetical protein [Escherichia coli]|uniref:hypothetical protein n=1 Tax=Escherichia coli TaxID=562 RepID=UPI000CFCB9DD|nr:hypothetical protein [Escherichia coli]